MKIRRGFVSNSSTTSFCIYGTWLESKDIAHLKDESYNVYQIAADNDLECHRMDYGGYCVGLHPQNMRDDETLAQFKRRVCDKIFKAFGVDDGADWIEEAYYS